jgi:two-component system, OmpR family, copper resistance phosphate regulon response regulator CusR
MKVLVIEDDLKVSEVLRRGLTEAGYEVTTASDGETGLNLALTTEFNIILLDINLPKVNGLELCKQLRQQDEITPVLMLTALGMSDDIVTGLEAGADDYLPKPFRFNELFARIKALTRRKVISNNAVKKPPGEKHVVFVLEDLSIDYDAKEVKRGEKLIQLTAKEYSLLEYLAQNVGKVKSRQEIAESVWGLDFETGTNFIDVYINYLRNKIDKPYPLKLIHTVTGFGYILKVPNA